MAFLAWSLGTHSISGSTRRVWWELLQARRSPGHSVRVARPRVTMVETWGGASKICHLIRDGGAVQRSLNKRTGTPKQQSPLPPGKGPTDREGPAIGQPLLALLLFSHLQVTPAAMWVLEKSHRTLLSCCPPA